MTLGDWLITFHMAAVVLDPYTYESAWVLEPARRILRQFREADCRVAFIVVGNDDEANQFLGPITKEVLTLTDPDRTFVKDAELEQLPAFLHIAQEGSIVGRAEGWDPVAWSDVATRLALRMHWTAPVIPMPGDPVAFPGSPAEGT